jgi:hypothetical protein
MRAAHDLGPDGPGHLKSRLCVSNPANVMNMARIRSLTLDTDPAHPPRTEVDCLYSTVHTRGGSKLLRLATLGSDLRKSEPKPSQIIEIDEAMARQLIQVMRSVFPGIDTTPPR